MKLPSGLFLKKSSTAAQPTNKKRNTSNTNNPKKKQKPNHDIRSLFCRPEERRNEEQTTGVNNKSDKQYHEVINLTKLYLVVFICESYKKDSRIIVFFSFFSRVFIFAVGIIPNFSRVLIFADGGKIYENHEN